MKQQYWVVGSMFGGVEDHLSSFIDRGYWYCWDPKVNPDIPTAVQNALPKIRKGDRIAVKKMMGQGSTNIEIRALGIVKDVDLSEWRVYVDWLVTDKSHEVPIKNYMGSIHGPVEPSEWRANAFEI